MAGTATAMTADEGYPVHSDFKLVERDGNDCEALIGIREALRSIWILPTDTFVTEDFPKLVTRCSLQPPLSGR